MAGSLDRSDGTLLNRYSGHTNRQFKLGACLSHDDALVLSGSEDGSLYVSGCLYVREAAAARATRPR